MSLKISVEECRTTCPLALKHPNEKDDPLRETRTKISWVVPADVCRGGLRRFV